MPRASTQPPSPAIVLRDDGDRLALEGVLDIRTLADVRSALRQWLEQRAKVTPAALDLGKLSGLTPRARCSVRARRPGRGRNGGSRRAPGAARSHLQPGPQAVAEAGFGPPVAPGHHRSGQGRGRRLARHARCHHLRWPGSKRGRTRAASSALPAVPIYFTTGRRNRGQSAAHHRLDGGHDQRRHRLPGRGPAASLRRRTASAWSRCRCCARWASCTAIMVAGRSGSAFAADRAMKAREKSASR